MNEYNNRGAAFGLFRFFCSTIPVFVPIDGFRGFIHTFFEYC